ncbi:MAG TPA: sialidase family protein [Blastocatellia bacterium]|jgi:hypothetical protein
MNKRTALVFLVTIVFALAAVSFSPWPRRAEAQFPQFFGATRFPAIDVDKNDNLYLTMSVATAPASERRPHSQIFFTMSRDGGANWDNFPQTRNLTKSPGEAFGPSLAVTKGGTARAYVTYHDNSSGVYQVYLIRSKKKAKFKKPARITPHDGGAFGPRLALDSNEAVNITWGDTLGGRRRVMFARSTDQGETFTEPLNISRSSGEAFEPEIAVDPGNAINVAWEDSATGVNSIMFSRSTDEGKTFSTPLRVSKGTDPATEAHIASDGAGRLSVVWVQGTEEEKQAYYSRSTDGGLTFSDPVNLSNTAGASISKPLIATFRDIVYVAYQNEARRDMQVYLTKSEDAGVSFSSPVQVSNADNSKGRAHSAAMVVDSRGVLHIVWIDASIVGNDEGLLFYSNSSNGRRFSPQQMILAAI